MATSPNQPTEAEKAAADKAAADKAAAEQATAKAAAEKAAAEKSSVKYIRAVHGRMVDPLTGAEFSQAPSKLFEHTGWIQSQLDANKMVLCDGPEVAE